MFEVEEHQFAEYAASSRTRQLTGRTLALVLAGGGRFDRLLTLLGAKERIPAVGFSLWLDRIASVKGRAA